MQVYPDMPWVRDILQVATVFLDCLRSIGYEILKLLAQLLDLCSDAVNGIMSINITQITPVQNFIDTMSPVSWSVLTVAIAAGGIYMMASGGKNKEIFRNLLFAVVLIVAIPVMFSKLNDFKDAGINDVQSLITNDTSAGQQILTSAVVDVSQSTDGKVTLDSNVNPYYININARLPKEDPWLYKITSVTGNDENEYKLYGEKLGNGFFGMGEERLYAYSFSFFAPFFTLLITIVAILFAGLKVARMIFDLLFHQAIAGIVFASDINSGIRTKKYLQSLAGSFITVILVLVILKIYLDLSSWVNLNISNVIEKILLLAGAAWGVIDGPDIVVKLLGVDAGVRSATSVLLGANAAIGAAGGAAHAAGSVARGVGKISGGVASMPYKLAGFDEKRGGKFGGKVSRGNFKPDSSGHQEKAQSIDGQDSFEETESMDNDPYTKSSPSPLEKADAATGGKASTSAEYAAAAASSKPVTQGSRRQSAAPEASERPGNTVKQSTQAASHPVEQASESKNAARVAAADNQPVSHAGVQPAKESAPSSDSQPILHLTPQPANAKSAARAAASDAQPVSHPYGNSVQPAAAGFTRQADDGRAAVEETGGASAKQAAEPYGYSYDTQAAPRKTAASEVRKSSVKLPVIPKMTEAPEDGRPKVTRQ